ncbi:MAG: SGNH/GDSL hydrolase family protein [Balneolaceae bacterium]|nr:SGNH/GDSL hydrolase family protein [Balneolaceae bacterium]
MIFKRIIYCLLPVLLFLNYSCKSQSTALSYLALGDSYTIGESVDKKQRWPVQLVDTLRKSGVNISDPRTIAKTGWTTTELKQVIHNASLNPPYDLVSLLIGVNDQYDGLDFETYPERFEYLLNKAIELAGGHPEHVFVVSIPDYSVTPFGQSKNPEKISRELDKYNAINKTIADRLGVGYVNITPGSKKAGADKTLIANDGLHPSGKMYSQWVDEIAPVVLPEIIKWEKTKQ